MYENAAKMMAKQRVALEVLSYHATAQEQEAEQLMVSVAFHCTVIVFTLIKTFAQNGKLLLNKILNYLNPFNYKKPI